MTPYHNDLATMHELEVRAAEATIVTWQGHRALRLENGLALIADRAARGYVDLGANAVRRTLAAGTHQIVAELQVNEGFGWGLALAARAKGLRWLPAELDKRI
jgi:hypothetical protein